MTEDEARAYLCAELPSLRRDAAAGGWLAALADALTVLDEGGTARDVLTLLDPATADEAEEADEWRGDPQPYLLFGAAGPELRGVYVCPDGWCPRRSGRDAANRPPVCDLRRRPMRFTES
ncbi:hypothetical protein [Nonomuraea sp. NPDC005692]|uniref:hypothetical protein n=1 Tax=Nonomuraea sp. NPDC005692 TaxID=3157168 RepID=UPI0033F2816A